MQEIAHFLSHAPTLAAVGLGLAICGLLMMTAAFGRNHRDNRRARRSWELVGLMRHASLAHAPGAVREYADEFRALVGDPRLYFLYGTSEVEMERLVVAARPKEEPPFMPGDQTPLALALRDHCETLVADDSDIVSEVDLTTGDETVHLDALLPEGCTYDPRVDPEVDDMVERTFEHNLLPGHSAS